MKTSIFICNKRFRRGTFGERKKEKREREIVFGYYILVNLYLLSIVKIKREIER